MYGSVQNETEKKKKETHSEDIKTQRKEQTADIQINRQSISANRGQQKRMVANAVASLAEVRQQRNNREARSLTWWNEMKKSCYLFLTVRRCSQTARESREHFSTAINNLKAIVKQYPDGRQEIVVPQILTPEQEHYQFPPRSKFLKQLQAAEMAEKRRDSSTINLSRIASARGLAEEQSVSVFYKIGSVYQNSSSNLNKNNRTIPPLDESTLKEWFTKNTKKPVSRKSKDRAVADWINEVERSKQISPSVSKKRPANKLSLASYFEGAFSHSTKMQFKSAAGKRWANILDINATLAPPNEACKVHYIPRKLLRLSCGMERKNISNTGTNDNAPVASTTISKIRELWKEYKRTIPSNITSFENKITTLVLTATEETTPLAALVHLLLQSHNDSDPLKDKSQEPRKTVMNLEIQLSIERRKRQEILQKLVATEVAYQQMCQDLDKQNNNSETNDTSTDRLLTRIAELEKSLEDETMARQKVENRLLQLAAKKTTNPSSPNPSKKPMIHSPKPTRPEHNKITTRRTRATSKPLISEPLTSTIVDAQPKTPKKKERVSTLASIGLAPVMKPSSTGRNQMDTHKNLNLKHVRTFRSKK